MEEKVTRCEACQTDIPGGLDGFKKHINKKTHRKRYKALQAQKHEETGLLVTGLPPSYARAELNKYLSKWGQVRKCLYPGPDRAVINMASKEICDTIRAASHTFKGHALTITSLSTEEKAARASELVEALNATSDFDSQLAVLLNLTQVPSGIEQSYIHVCRDLEDALHKTFPTSSVHPFGSTVTRLDLAGSDVDIFLDGTPLIGEAVKLKWISNALRLDGKMKRFRNVVPIKAKTPIVKCVHVPTGISCDISFKNCLGLRNTQLLRCLIDLDPRIKPVVLIIKYWAKHFELSCQNHISNYALTLKVIAYLQQLTPALLPSVRQLMDACQEKVFVDGWECSFSPIRWIPLDVNFNVPEMVAGFFKYYSGFCYQGLVISPLTGTPVNKADVGEMGGASDICVQDPFVLDHNVCRGMSVKDLLRLVQFYTLAAEVKVGCPGYLSALLAEEHKAALTSHVIVIQVSRFSKTSVNHDADVNARANWAAKVYDYLLEILERICRLEVDAPARPAKVSRMDRQWDVHDSPVSLTCRGRWNVMQGRSSADAKAVKKVVNTSGVISSPIQAEEMITEWVIKRLEEQAAKAEVCFSCQFQASTERAEVTLKLVDKGIKGGSLAMWHMFLNKNLSKWLEATFAHHHWCQQAREILGK